MVRLLTAMLAFAALSASGADYFPLEWPEADRAAIVWRADWDATLQTNAAAWNGDQRVVLLETMLLRTNLNATTKQCAEGSIELAGLLAKAGDWDRAAIWGRYAVGAVPGDLDLAGRALTLLLSSPIDEAFDWTLRRIEAARDSGLVPAAMWRQAPWRDASQREYAGLVARNRCWEAALLARRLRGLGLTDYGLKLVYLHAAAEDVEGATRILDELERDKALALDFPAIRQQYAKNRSGKAGVVSTDQERLRDWSLISGGEQSEPTAITEAQGRMVADAAAFEQEPGLYVSLWKKFDAALSAAKPETLAALRAYQETAAAPEIADAAGRRDAVALFRKFPWAAGAQVGLLRQAERELRAGQTGIALRGFEDVLSHTADPSARAQAQAGRQLALRATDADTAGKAARAPTAPAAELKRFLPAPPGPAWTHQIFRAQERWSEERPCWFVDFPSLTGELIQGGGRFFVAGPQVLACYEPGSRAAAWVRGAPLLPERPESGVRVPGPIVPSIGARRVVTRWFQKNGLHMTGVAAFDLETGATLWTTQQGAASGLSPLGDPVQADGRVYFLALPGGADALSQPDSGAISLVCLDAATGELLWKSPICPADNLAFGVWQSYGGAVLARRGAVYCQTSAGILARCDARDGLIEWRRAYPRHAAALLESDGATYRCLKRIGPPPVAGDGVVVFMPRDRRGLFGLDPESGQTRWTNPFIEVQGCVGTARGKEDIVVIRQGRDLYGVRLGDGEVAWQRGFPSIDGCCFDNGKVALLSGGDLLQLDGVGGDTLGRSPWPEAQAALAVSGDTIASIGPAETRDFMAPVAAPKEQLSGALEFPLLQALFLARRQAEFLTPPAEAKLSGVVYVLSEGLVECLETTPPFKIRWQRALEDRPDTVCWADGTLALISKNWILGLDARDGALRCAIRPPVQLIREDSGRVRNGAISNPAADTVVLWDSLDYTINCAGINVSSGKVAWVRHGVTWPGLRQLRIVSASGGNARVFGVNADTNSTPGVLTLRLADGAIIKRQRFPAGSGLKNILADGRDVVWGIGLNGAVMEYSLADGQAIRHKTLKELGLAGESLGAKVEGPWLLLEAPGEGKLDGPVNRTVLLKQGQPNLALQREGHFESLRDGSFWQRRMVYPSKESRYYPYPDWSYRIETSPTRFDPATGAEERYRLPPAPFGPVEQSILAVHRAGERLWTLARCRRFADYSGASDAIPTDFQVRLDAFDPASGRSLGWQYVPGLNRGGSGDRPPQLLQTGGQGIFVADDAGVRVFSGATPDRAPPEIVPVYRGTADGGGAELCPGVRVSHDQANLSLSIEIPSGDQARLPVAAPRGADSLDLVLRLGVGEQAATGRFRVGTEADGAVVIVYPDPASRRASVDMRLSAAMRANPDGGRLGYTLTLPTRGTRQVCLSLAAWRDTAAGPKRLLAVGADLAQPYPAPTEHRLLGLIPWTRPEEESLFTLTEKLPDTKDTVDFLLAWVGARALTPEEYRRQAIELIRRHPAAVSAEFLLAAEREIAKRAAAWEGTWSLEDAAAKAGVQAAALERYRAIKNICISQWVRCAGEPPEALTFGRYACWPETMYFASRSYARISLGPPPVAREWTELRIPLYLFGPVQTPISVPKLEFGQRGGGQFLWGKTAVVASGKEYPLLDGRLPDGARASGASWEWIAGAALNGSVPHALPQPVSRDVLDSQTIVLAKPIIIDPTNALPAAPVPDPKVVATALREAIPALGGMEHAWKLIEQLKAIINPDGKETTQTAGMIAWSIKVAPRNPRIPDALKALVELYRAQGRQDAVEAVQTLARESGVDPEAVWRFNLECAWTNSSVAPRAWSAIGPFEPRADGNETGFDAEFPPEKDGLRLRSKYELTPGGLSGTWRAVPLSKGSWGDVRPYRIGDSSRGVFYCRASIASERELAAMLEIVKARQPTKVWLNGRLEIVLPGGGNGLAPVRLRRGANLILVKTGRDGFSGITLHPTGPTPLQGVVSSE